MRTSGRRTGRANLGFTKARFVVVAAAAIVGCGPNGGNGDAGDAGEGGMPPATDIFVRAAASVPGGVFLGAWVPSYGSVQRPNTPAGSFDQYAYFVGGYDGVDPSALPTSASVGRLVGYDGAGTFTTLCRTDHVLRGVGASGGVVLAVGDGATVVRYTPSTGMCDTLSVGTVPPGEQLRLYGMASSAAPTAETFVVGASTGGGTTTPIVERFDGTQFTPETLPAGVDGETLESISYDSVVGFWIVGTTNETLHHTAGVMGWDTSTTPTSGPFTAVSTESESPRRWTMVVGGTAGPQILARKQSDSSWSSRTDYNPGTPVLIGVYTRSNYEVYEVGIGGTNLVYNGLNYYVPPGAPLTSDDLVAVAGSDGFVIAVGGDRSDTSANQHGVVLVRGDFVTHDTYSFDGVSYAAAGRTRLEFGLGAGSPQ